MSLLKEGCNMSKNKKSFDRDLMYKKIMPTTIKGLEASQESEKVLSTYAVGGENLEEGSIFKDKELNFIKEEKKEDILYNITEKVVLVKLEVVLKRMNCCRCNRCKQDIIAIALNNLKPLYVVATRDEIEQKIDSMKDMGSKVITEVIKAILIVRKNPRH
jgi:competence protein ComFB